MDHESNYIFYSPRNPNKPIKNIRTEFNKLKNKLNIDKNKSIHSFRHALATEMGKLVSLKIVGDMLGHADIRTTTRYQHVDTEAMMDALAKMDTKLLKEAIKD